MVYYPRPKFIKKSDLREARPFKWSDLAKRADSVAQHATCMRCAQDIASQKVICDKPDDLRCKHCADHNRGGCSLVPPELNGRVNRMYQLRAAYDTAVTNAADRKTDAVVRTTGVKLARAQRSFNLELSSKRRLAARGGAPLGVATQTPTTTPQFLGLILAEQRNMVAIFRELVSVVGRLAAPAGNDDGDDDDDDDEGAGRGEGGGEEMEG